MDVKDQITVSFSRSPFLWNFIHIFIIT